MLLKSVSCILTKSMPLEGAYDITNTPVIAHGVGRAVGVLGSGVCFVSSLSNQVIFHDACRLLHQHKNLSCKYMACKNKTKKANGSIEQ